MNVVGFTLREVSSTNTTIVGSVRPSVSVMMVPEADQVNTSSCPGVSMITRLCSLALFSMYCSTWSN